MGYYAKSGYRTKNTLYKNWLFSSGSSFAPTYNCMKCYCEVLIRYTPATTITSSVSTSSLSKSLSSSGGIIAAIVVPVFCVATMCAAGYFFFFKRCSQQRENHVIPHLLHVLLLPSHDHLEVLKWVRENSCPWDESVCYQAAKFGRLNIRQRLLQH